MKRERRIRDFLIELRALSLHHNIFISGCGCCGSPYLTVEEEAPDTNGAYILEGPESDLTYLTVAKLEHDIESWTITSIAEEKQEALKKVKSILNEVEQ